MAANIFTAIRRAHIPQPHCQALRRRRAARAEVAVRSMAREALAMPWTPRLAGFYERMCVMHATRLQLEWNGRCS